MTIDIKYSKHVDLIFHVLAYMHVNNASNCFEQSYIDIMQKEKSNFDFDLLTEIKTLEKYYNDYFERVMLINFLPFFSNSFDELKKVFLNCTYFTDSDKNIFIKPFISLLEKESIFYFEYWQNKYDSISYQRQSIESHLKKELGQYSCLFDYYNKSALVYLSISITKNGRGFNGIHSYFSAITPLPKAENDFDNTFFTLLHEYTHQFTDDLLKADINLMDGSHDLSENIAILADYYLIKSIDYFTVEKYLRWLVAKNENQNYELNELNFLEIFKIEDCLDFKLKKLIHTILEK